MNREPSTSRNPSGQPQVEVPEPIHLVNTLVRDAVPTGTNAVRMQLTRLPRLSLVLSTALKAHFEHVVALPGRIGPVQMAQSVVFTSASPCCFDGGDVDFIHRHHCLEGTFCLRPARRERVG